MSPWMSRRTARTRNAPSCRRRGIDSRHVQIRSSTMVRVTPALHDSPTCRHYITTGVGVSFLLAKIDLFPLPRHLASRPPGAVFRPIQAANEFGGFVRQTSSLLPCIYFYPASAHTTRGTREWFLSGITTDYGESEERFRRRSNKPRQKGWF